MIFTLDAHDLSEWQTCRRRYVMGSEHVPKRWRPKALLSRCLRTAIVEVSSGADPATAAKAARTEFMQRAADDGLEFPGGDTYRLAMDLCMVMDVVVRCMAKLILLVVKPAPDLELEPGIIWRTLAVEDESGTLHRWTFHDRVDADARVREAHSWYVAGDVMLSRAPMTLHMVEVGRMREGRWRSPWTTAWRLPQLRNAVYHFRSKLGKELQGAWEAVYLAEDKRLDVDEWAEKCQAEGQATTLVHHLQVVEPPEAACRVTTEMIRAEARAMQAARGRAWVEFPMQRPMCDGLVPCVWQPACYSTELVNLDNSGLFRRKDGTRVLASEEVGAT